MQERKSPHKRVPDKESRHKERDSSVSDDERALGKKTPGKGTGGTPLKSIKQNNERRRSSAPASSSSVSYDEVD